MKIEMPQTTTHPLITPLPHPVPCTHKEHQHKPHRTLHHPLKRREHAGTATSANKLGTPKTETAIFIVDAADGYTTVNIMEASSYQVCIPKPTHTGIDTDVGATIEIAKSLEPHIPKKVSGTAKDDYVAVLKSAVGSLKIDKNGLKKLQERIGESMRV